MTSFKAGDAVTRKSYGGDILFRISSVDDRATEKRTYVLKGVLYRIEADASEDDLEILPSRMVHQHIQRSLAGYYRRNSGLLTHVDSGNDDGEVRKGSPGSSIPAGFTRRYGGRYGAFRGFGGFSGLGEFMSYISKSRGTPGRILHLDSSGDFLNMSYNYYRKSNLIFSGKEIPESEQPEQVERLLEKTNADILVITGHDGIKKDSSKLNSIDGYRNSAYFIRSVERARNYQKDMDKLCIFAGACQSYYEGIMAAGANFASSPGRVLIHALDPAKVADNVALTDSRRYVTAAKIAEETQSGLKGIGGVNTRGHFII
jgi:spore coat assembly protein